MRLETRFGSVLEAPYNISGAATGVGRVVPEVDEVDDEADDEADDAEENVPHVHHAGVSQHHVEPPLGDRHEPDDQDVSEEEDEDQPA